MNSNFRFYLSISVAIGVLAVAYLNRESLARLGGGPPADIEVNPFACSGIVAGYKYSEAGLERTVANVYPSRGIVTVSTEGELGTDPVRCELVPVKTR